jgi:PadR family transcriptional regulator PadR
MADANSSAQVLKGLLDAIVLTVLTEEDNYGFGIIQEVSARLGQDREVLREATLYPLLHRMEGKGLVDAYWRPGERGTDRKYYRITAAGRKHLEARLDDWRQVARVLRGLGMAH